MMAFRIAWFKVHEPLAFYATFFTVRAKAFDAEYCCAGLDAVKRKIREIENNKGRVGGQAGSDDHARGLLSSIAAASTLTPSTSTAPTRQSSPSPKAASCRRSSQIHGLGEAAALDTVKRRGQGFISVEGVLHVLQ